MSNDERAAAPTAPLNYDPADPDKMRLPVGSTCYDCWHYKRCAALIGQQPGATACDWSPSRFARNP